jgi:hypothetical protein
VGGWGIEFAVHCSLPPRCRKRARTRRNNLCSNSNAPPPVCANAQLSYGGYSTAKAFENRFGADKHQRLFRRDSRPSRARRNARR